METGGGNWTCIAGANFWTGVAGVCGMGARGGGIPACMGTGGSAGGAAAVSDEIVGS